MGVTEGLKKDHELLRLKLSFIEAAMEVAPEAQFALREMCFSLARLLDGHIRREQQVLAPYGGRLGALRTSHLAEDHADQRVTLRDVNAVLLGGIHAPVSTIVPPLASLIKALREHMAEEEREVFPAVERFAGEDAPAEALAPSAPAITGAMTVNHVLKVHPRAREIFRAFDISCESDGLHGLEELYWRRGIDVSALLKALNEAPVVGHAMAGDAS